MDGNIQPNEYGLVGESQYIKNLSKFISTISQLESNILILGETGTGKSLIARSIHNHSKRNGKFILMNMAAIPDTLIEAELFGTEKGAYTGSTYLRIGAFERAQGGTIFLDEIGEMGAAQNKLLNALEENSFSRIGGQEEIPLDVRIIAATSGNVKDAKGNRKLLPAIFYRLANNLIRTLPLRNQQDDIPLLAYYFIQEINRERNVSYYFSKESLEHLKKYDWPGNIRELKVIISNTVTYLKSLDQSRMEITPEDVYLILKNIKLEDDNYTDSEETLIKNLTRKTQFPFGSLEEMTKWAIELISKEESGNISRIAARLGISRSTVYRYLKES
jgi:transcriptional regulator with PAS, ATPase and Fis domain